MKQWLNNWEKNIGKQLHNAEVKPEGHVWELLEQELDLQDATKRNNTYKWAAGIAILLLLTASAGFFMPSNSNSQYALDYGALNFPELNIKTFDAASIPVADKPIETFTSNSVVVQNFAQEQLDAKEVEIRRSEYLSADLSGLTNNIKSDLVISHDFTDLNENISAIHRSAIVQLDLQGIQSGISYDNLNILRVKRDIRDLNRLDEIVNAMVLENECLRTTQVNSMNAAQSTQPLAFNDEAIAFNNHSVKSSNNQLIASSIQMLDRMPITDLFVEEMMAENMEIVAANSWVAEAMGEIDEWKSELEEEEGELEELIDEANLDEEDPLTKRENLTKSLFRQNNINKGFHIGIISGVQHNWTTRASRNSEIDRSKVEYKFSPGYQAGINIGYDFADHFGIMAEIKYSDEGTKYFNPVTQRNEHLDLKYLELPVYLKAKHSKMTAKSRPIVFNYLLGASYSDLRKVETFVEGEDKRFGQDYNTSEWGLTAGFDFDLYLSKNFFFTVGTRAGVNGFSKSFPKFKGNDNGNQAMTYNLGVYTRFNFRKPGH